MTTTEPADIAALLAVEPLGDDRFLAPARQPDHPFGGLFGGEALALGLRAAGATVADDRQPHSLHGYFLRPGDSRVDMEIEVGRDTDGRSFSARRVAIRQAGRVIFTMTASFHVPEAGDEHQVPTMPTGVPGPDEVATPTMLHPFRPATVVEVRDAGNRFDQEGMPTRAWGRAIGPLPEDPLLHACVLVHFSDLYTGLPAMDGTFDHGGPSLDHAFWFHRPARLDDWILMDLEPVSSGRGRGLYHGAFYDRSGLLVASLAQEVLYSRSRPARARPPWVKGEPGGIVSE